MTTKPYSTDEIPQSQPVSEPAVSYGLPQDTASLKLAAINELMNIFDPERLSQAVDYLRSLGREEVKESVPPYKNRYGAVPSRTGTYKRRNA